MDTITAEVLLNACWRWIWRDNRWQHLSSRCRRCCCCCCCCCCMALTRLRQADYSLISLRGLISGTDARPWCDRYAIKHYSDGREHASDSLLTIAFIAHRLWRKRKTVDLQTTLNMTRSGRLSTRWRRSEMKTQVTHSVSNYIITNSAIHASQTRCDLGYGLCPFRTELPWYWPEMSFYIMR